MKDIIQLMINQAETEENYSLINYVKLLIDKMASTYNAPSNWRDIGEDLAEKYDDSNWVYEELKLWNHSNN